MDQICSDVYHFRPSMARDRRKLARLRPEVARFRAYLGHPGRRNDCYLGRVLGNAVQRGGGRHVGEHMVTGLNFVGIDTACYGNHDFDFGVDQLVKMAGETNFPWLISNVTDKAVLRPARAHRAGPWGRRGFADIRRVDLAHRPGSSALIASGARRSLGVGPRRVAARVAAEALIAPGKFEIEGRAAGAEKRARSTLWGAAQNSASHKAWRVGEVPPAPVDAKLGLPVAPMCSSKSEL